MKYCLLPKLKDPKIFPFKDLLECLRNAQFTSSAYLLYSVLELAQSNTGRYSVNLRHDFQTMQVIVNYFRRPKAIDKFGRPCNVSFLVAFFMLRRSAVKQTRILFRVNKRISFGSHYLISICHCVELSYDCSKAIYT